MLSRKMKLFGIVLLVTAVMIDGVIVFPTVQFYLWQIEALQGNIDAQKNLAHAYLAGKGTQENDKEAVKWYRKAADQGDAEAQDNLGNCYHNGRGVEQDNKEAVIWWNKASDRRAEERRTVKEHQVGGMGAFPAMQAYLWKIEAKQGNAEAQLALGWAYYNGEGIEKDTKEAINCWRKAADKGNAEAQAILKVQGK
jgi:uncharacterized protein